MKKQLIANYFYKHIHFYIYELPDKIWWEGEIDGERYGNAIGIGNATYFKPAHYIELYDNAVRTIDSIVLTSKV